MTSHLLKSGDAQSSGQNGAIQYQTKGQYQLAKEIWCIIPIGYGSTTIVTTKDCDIFVNYLEIADTEVLGIRILESLIGNRLDLPFGCH